MGMFIYGRQEKKMNNNTEDFFLMHEDTPVGVIRTFNHIPLYYVDVFRPEELPVGTRSKQQSTERILLKKWFESRCIPPQRPDINKITDILGRTEAELFFDNAGISLTDTYWFTKELNNPSIQWKNINFHDNGFEPVLAKWYLGDSLEWSKSPDFTTDGIMEKCWISHNGIPHLLKTDYAYGEVLCANELVYSKIAKMAGVNSIDYYFGKIKGTKYCECESFVTDAHTDFISAMQVKHSDFSLYGTDLLNYFEKTLGFSEIRKMVTLDCILHNTDRHEKNFGYLRNKSGIQMAPLYDNGFCLGVNYQNAEDGFVSDADMKLFEGKRAEFMQKCGNPLYLDPERCFFILETVYKEYDIEAKYLEKAKKEIQYGLNVAKEVGMILPEKESLEDYER